MARLSLTLACCRYDRTEALRSGDVQVEGVDLNLLTLAHGREIFDRMVGGLEFDASELSISEFISLAGTGNSPFVAIPVFISRVFRHGFVFVNTRSGIRTPKDLEGKRVGLPLYTQSAALWVRGHLSSQYGVNLDTVKWVQGAVENAGTHGKPFAPPLLKPVPIEQNASGHSLDELLATGEIDALIGSRKPASLGKNPDVVRLFPNYREVERDFFRKTRIFPIMHLIAIRRDVHEKHPWFANSLYRAFVESKKRARTRLYYAGSLVTMLPWQLADVEEIEDVFDGDAFPYGVEPNRPTLEALVRHMVEQNFIAKPIPIEELFVPLPGAMEH
jgi:4,5-dihydroxyphthalate decarboxylase